MRDRHNRNDVCTIAQIDAIGGTLTKMCPCLSCCYGIMEIVAAAQQGPMIGWLAHRQLSKSTGK